MNKSALRDTNLAQFRTMPLLATTATISVSRSVVELSPEKLPDYVEASKQRLVVAITTTQSAITSRLESTFNLGAERSFDILVDYVWSVLRSRLEFWSLYGHEGVVLFSEDERQELQLAESLELAKTAAQLLDRLFGDGVNFARLAYPEQAEHMAARLRYIDREGLASVFEQLVGHQPAVLVRVCQRRYETMVSDRNVREGGVSVNLRLLRDQLRGAVEDYANLLLSTLHGAEDEWFEQVFASLRPIVVARSQARRGVGVLEAEQQAQLEAALEELDPGETVEAAIPPEADDASAPEG